MWITERKQLKIFKIVVKIFEYVKQYNKIHLKGWQHLKNESVGVRVVERTSTQSSVILISIDDLEIRSSNSGDNFNVIFNKKVIYVIK